MTSIETELMGSTGITPEGQDVNEFEEPDLSPEEYADHTAKMVASAMEATKMFGVVEVQAGVGQAHILGRVKQDKERLFAEKVVYPVLIAIKKDPNCNGFVGKQYMLKDGDKYENMRYAWVFSFASNDLRSAAHNICEAFRGAIPRMEVVEGPLMGPSTPQSGGQSSGRKGASPVR